MFELAEMGWILVGDEGGFLDGFKLFRVLLVDSMDAGS